MDKRFTAIVVISLLISVYEVFSNGNNGDEHEKDNSFKQFDDSDEEEPSFKYSKDAQRDLAAGEEEEVMIREPAGAKKTFKPPINMPPVKFAFWYVFWLLIFRMN